MDIKFYIKCLIVALAVGFIYFSLWHGVNIEVGKQGTGNYIKFETYPAKNYFE